MRKFICLAVALAVTSLAVAQEPKVTYTTVAVSVKKAISDIAAQTGLKLACSPAMAGEIVVLRLKDAPAEEVLKQIAGVTAGRWDQQGEIRYLVADQSARQIQTNLQQQKLAQKISQAFKKMAEAKKQKAPKDNPASEAADGEAAMFGFGSYQSLSDLAVAIGAGALSTVPEDGRVVFSTNPNRMQRALPANAGEYINAFVIEYNKVAAAAKQAEPDQAKNDEMNQFMAIFGDRMKKPEPIKTAPAKAIVVATRQGTFSSFTLELKLYDANGKVLADQNMPLQVDTFPFNPQDIMNPKPTPPDKSAPITLSPEAKELADIPGSFTMGGSSGNLKLSKELMAALRDPVARDPLSFMHSEGLISVAEQRNEQLVADLPDSLVSFFGTLGKKATLTVDAFMQRITGDDKTSVAESGGWMIVTPENPPQSRRERADRAALKSLMDKAQSEGVLRLDDLAAYAQRNGSPMDDAPATATYIMLFAPSAIQQGMMGMTDWNMLRLYGSLADEQRQALRQGRRIPFSQLGPGPQATLAKMLFGPEGALTIDAPSNKPKQDPLTELIMDQISRFGAGNDADYRTEPTEVMPNGLPSDGFVAVKFTSEPVAQPQKISTDLGMGSTLGPMELGILKFFKEDPNMSQMEGMMPTMDDFKVGTRSVYNFSFYVAPQVCEKKTLHDDAIAKDAAVYKATSLPPDFQKRIDEMAASMKNNPLWKMVGQMGGFGRQTPPPQF